MSYSEDMEILSNYFLPISPKPDDLDFPFTRTHKRSYVFRRLMVSQSFKLNILSRYFKDKRSIDMFIVEITEIYEVAKQNGLYLWLNPIWVEEQPMFEKVGKKKNNKSNI